MSLKKLLSPKSIAVIGASSDKEKLGGQVLENLKRNRYQGKIYPVNPGHERVGGLKCYSRVLDVKEKIDLAIVIIPAKFVIDVIKDCATSNVKNVIIISAGFSEAGEDGRKKEEELKSIADNNKINILGPNCLGLINSNQNLNATFANFDVSGSRNKKGIAFVSQSGAIGSAVFDWISDQSLTLNYFASLGNKAVLDENDFFEYLGEDKNTKVVAAYLEEIQNGQKFMKTVSELSKKKPVVVLKSGRSEAGQKAALSHTGSLAGSAKAMEAGLRRSGAIVAESLEDFFMLLKLLQNSKLEFKNGKEKDDLCIISNAGGPMVATVDRLEEANLKLCKFSDDLTNKLTRELPKLTSYKNPLDILGDAGKDRYEKALNLILKNNKISNVLILLTPQTSTDIKGSAEVIAEAANKYPDKLVSCSFIGGKSLNEARGLLNKSKATHFDYPGQAVSSLAKFLDYKRNLKSLKPYIYNQGSEEAVGKKSKNKDYLESVKLLSSYGIKVVKTGPVKSKKDLAGFKYPIAMKMVGEGIVHKTDEKAIKLNIESKKGGEVAFNDFSKRFKKGYVVAQPMVGEGLEMILGFKRDKSFGPIIMVGLGGVYAEVFKDVQTEVGDINKQRALRAIKKLKAHPVLRGVRGEEGYDVDALADAMVKMAELARNNPQIDELDINPFFLKEKGGIAADVRVIERE